MSTDDNVLRTSYEQCFNHSSNKRAARDVLQDLAAFCNVAKSSVHIGAPDLTAYEEGKRAVWLHLMQQLHYNDLQQMRIAYRLDHERNTQND